MNAEYRKYLIIGAGPGGLQLAYFLQQAGLDYLVLERAEVPGAFFVKHPVHRTLISINKKHNFFEEDEFNWRHDWNSLLSDNPALRFTNYSDELFPPADVLVQYVADYAREHHLDIRYNAEVTMVKREGEGFRVTIKDGNQYTCDVLLMATGAVKGVVPEDIEGIEHTVPYSEQSMDLELYRNKRVGILGGGNSAFETADYLAGSAAFVHLLTKHAPKMAWDTHFPGDLRAINNTVIDMYQLKSLAAVLNPRIRKIEKLPDGTLMTHHSYDYPYSNPPGTLELTREYDIIINCTGFNWVDLDIFDESAKPQTRKGIKYPLLNEMWESENVPNMYFVGGAMQSRDRKSASGFIHGFRYNVRSLANILQHRHEGKELETIEHPQFDIESFLDDMYQRLSLSAGLFQLYGFLGDLIIFSEDLKSYKEMRELPVDYIKSIVPGDRHALMITLEFGFHKYHESAVNFTGPSDPNDTPCAAFLHPVIRHFHDGQMDEFHFGDSLLGRWDRPHGKGGAVMSYHYDFQKWLEQKLGLDFHLPEPEAAGNYRAWTPEEIETWRMKEMEMQPMEKPCGRKPYAMAP